ncbi:MAG: IS3 family transposase, partial [Leptospiraceae bacterium]|nr:IS3 family transposase [Leptospiraceae bacterium]
LAPEFGIVKSCKALEISISSFYYQSDAKIKRKQEDKQLIEKIEAYLDLMPQSGYRSVTYFLRNDMKINHKRVYRIMHENLLKCSPKRAYHHATTDSKHNLKKYPNLLKDKSINHARVIVGDVTFFDVQGKNHYLASLMDMENREVIGRAVSDKLNSELVRSAFESALMNRGSLEGYIHHTDSDRRYCSHEYIELLNNSKIQISMCLGNAYENAHAESFNKTIKYQEINISCYADKIEAAKSIFQFIDRYNSIRPHSALGGLSPLQFKNKQKI